MKRFIILLICLIIPIYGYSQNINKNNDKDSVTVVINVSKVSKTLGNIVKFVKDEVKQFKDEAVDNMSPKDKENYKRAIENIKYEMKYTHDAIHAGWAAGWRGEDYTPPYKHK